jgi:MFS family permease
MALMSLGLTTLAAFVVIESRVEAPMFDLRLLRIRAFSYGNVSTLLSSIARGGLMFMLIIWLQGIWLPLHGYSFTDTPLWAGIYMLPMTLGLLAAGPISGHFSDRYGARPFATGGMIMAATGFVLLWILPTNFAYPTFAAVLAINGIAMGLFQAPNKAAVMNSLPASQRGAGGGMNSTFQNSAQVLSVGIFFSLMIAGLGASLPHTLASGLQAHGVSAADAHTIGQTPPVAVLFAAFLGYNPILHLVGPHVLHSLTPQAQAALTGQTFFPHLISAPFRDGLHAAFGFAIAACIIAAAASLMRGGKYQYEDAEAAEEIEEIGPLASVAMVDAH